MGFGRVKFLWLVIFHSLRTLSSVFSGDESEKRQWEELAEAFDTRDYWSSHPKLLNTMTFQARPTVSVKVHDQDGHLTSVIARIKSIESTLVPSSAELFNPLEGKMNARQLSETIPEFLKRLPPLDTHWPPDGWIWIANPYSKPEHSQRHQDVVTFEREGSQLLRNYRELRERLEAENPGKTKANITRMLGPERDAMKQQIEELAIETKVLTGKWMLFPTVNNVPRTWRTICEAVSENRLGPEAKLATGSNKAEDDGIRVICVYTKDFRDVEDIERVVRALDDLGLLPRDGNRSIYYKSDAYTWLDIKSTNEYNFQASLYSSKDMLGGDSSTIPAKRGAPASKAKEPVRKKQATGTSKGKEPVKKKQTTLKGGFLSVS